MFLAVFRFCRAIFRRKVRHDKVIHAEDFIVFNDFVNVVYHIVKGDMRADGTKAHAVQDPADIGGSKSIETGQFHAVVADSLHLAHDIFKIFRGVLKKVAQTIDLDADRKFFIHDISPYAALTSGCFNLNITDVAARFKNNNSFICNVALMPFLPLS